MVGGAVAGRCGKAAGGRVVEGLGGGAVAGRCGKAAGGRVVEGLGGGADVGRWAVRRGGPPGYTTRSDTRHCRPHLPQITLILPPSRTPLPRRPTVGPNTAAKHAGPATFTATTSVSVAGTAFVPDRFRPSRLSIPPHLRPIPRHGADPIAGARVSPAPAARTDIVL